VKPLPAGRSSHIPLPLPPHTTAQARFVKKKKKSPIPNLVGPFYRIRILVHRR
jgi:hypothetical protein